MQFLKSRAAAGLGPLETAVMEILWTHGELNVHEVGQRLARPLAYTTVMTTLDRLYKKELLNRRKSERAFLYSPSLSRADWDRRRAGEFLADFLEAPRSSSDLLISCLVDAVGHDETLLDELERKIRIRRKELAKRSAQ